MIRADLPVDVQDVLAATIANWRRKELCPDPVAHRDFNGNSENVRRLMAAGLYEPAPAGFCDYCSRRLP